MVFQHRIETKKKLVRMSQVDQQVSVILHWLMVTIVV